MWLIDRLWTPRPPLSTPAKPGAIPESASRRAPLKRSARVGRTGMAPWQKIAPPRRH